MNTPLAKDYEETTEIFQEANNIFFKECAIQFIRKNIMDS